MAREYKGLFLQLGIEGDKLLREFEAVDVKLRGTQRELNVLQRSLRLEFDSEKFKKAQELAQRAVEESKQKVDALKKAMQEADNQGLSKTTAEYKDLQKELDKAELAAIRAGKKIEDINNIKLDKLKKELDELQNKVNKAGDDLLSAGKKAATGTAAAAAGLGYAAKTAIDYEQAFVGVVKTVEATDEQLKRLNAELLEMTTNTPVSAEALAEIAASAGQLGIKVENILGFTKTIADLGVASNLAGEEGASMLAKFANITQMPQTDFDRLGSSIVDLGNNSATTEKDIAEMALRLAAAGSQAGMTEAEILGFAAALSSVGIEAQAGGSAFSKVFNEMNVAVQTGSKTLTDFANVAGMTTAEFQKAFNENAAGAVTEFIKGLEGAGKGAVVILEEMGITEVRMRDALLRSAGAGDLLTDSINLSTKAWEENTALTNEAEKAYQSTANQIQLMKNEINKAAIEIGNILLPYIRDGINDVKEFAQWFSNLDEGTQKLMIKLVALSGSLAALLLTMGLLTKGIGAAIGVYKTLTVAVTAYNTATAAGATATKAFTAALASNPAGLIAIGVTALAVAIGAFMIATKDATSEASKLNDELKDLTKEFENNKKAIQENEAAELAKADTARRLTAELYALEERLKSGTLTELEATAVKKQMFDISEQLKGLIPGLIIEIDNETGALNTQRGEVESLISSYERLAKAKAAQSLLEKAYETQLEAQVKKDQAVKGQAGALYNIDYLSGRTRPSGGVTPEEANVNRALLQTETRAKREFEKVGAEADKTLAETSAYIETLKATLESIGISEEETKKLSPPATTPPSPPPYTRTTSTPSGGGGGAKTDNTEREAEQQRKAQVKAYTDEIKERERIDERYRKIKKEYGELSQIDELSQIGEQAKRYREYAQDVLTVEFMTQDEKLSLHKEYTEKAEDLELSHFKFAQDMRQKVIDEYEKKVEEAKKIAEKEHAHAQKLIEEYLNDRTKGIEKALKQEQTAIKNTLDSELESIRRRISAQKELLQVKIDAINAEIQKRRELREDEEIDTKIQNIQKQIAATQTQIMYARDEDTLRELQRQLARQQDSLSKAIRDKEDTDFYRSKQAEIDSLRGQMRALDDRQASQIAQAQERAAKAERRARSAATAQISAAERAAYNSATTVYRQYYDTSTATTTYNQQTGTVILQNASISSAQIANILNKITG